MTTLVAPYQWGYQWQSLTGDATITPGQFWTKSDLGYMRSTCFADGGDGGSVWCHTMLGFFLYPGKGHTNSYLNLAATVDYNYSWNCWGIFSTAWAKGGLGLLVNRFDLKGTFVDAPVDTFGYLWNDRATDSDDGDSGAVTGVSLSAMVADVDSDHYYNVWVHMATHALNNGEGPFSYSWANGHLNLHVQSMTYNLYS